MVQILRHSLNSFENESKWKRDGGKKNEKRRFFFSSSKKPLKLRCPEIKGN